MTTEVKKSSLPKTLEEFLLWEPEDGFKYEWNDGELIKFEGIKKKEYYIYGILNRLFFEKKYIEKGSLISEPDVMLTGIQMRRPDIAYFSYEQQDAGRNGEDVIPEFVIELISFNDEFEKVETKLTEYFKAGVKVVWHILPQNQLVYVYTGRKQVKICTDDDICSAAPILPEFEISVNQIFAPTLV
ncbi:MAG: Uma2 family endonuclease [Spirosomaceae bacterium]|jgi:Uma2 family endonuclease|nr:Uma2 family endonuclease [Spirosomataceae bacterium]